MNAASASPFDTIKIGIVSISDRASTGAYVDKGLPALQDWLTRALQNPLQFEPRLIPDEQATISATRRLGACRSCFQPAHNHHRRAQFLKRFTGAGMASILQKPLAYEVYMTTREDSPRIRVSRAADDDLDHSPFRARRSDTPMTRDRRKP